MNSSEATCVSFPWILGKVSIILHDLFFPLTLCLFTQSNIDFFLSQPANILIEMLTLKDNQQHPDQMGNIHIHKKPSPFYELCGKKSFLERKEKKKNTVRFGTTINRLGRLFQLCLFQSVYQPPSDMTHEEVGNCFNPRQTQSCYGLK